MPPRRTFLSRVTAATVAVFTLSTTLALGVPAAAVPPYTMEERAFAIAGPSLLFVEMRSIGLVRRKDNGEALHTAPFTVSYRCTGFVVSSTGHAVTTTQCAQPDATSLRNNAINLFVADRIKAGTVATADKDAYTKQIQGIAEFTGESPGSKPDSTVYGQLFQGQVGLTTEPAMQAELVAAQATNAGGVALLKFPITGLPMAELSADQVNTSAPVVLVAFGVDSGSSVYSARLKPTKITGRSGTQTPVTYILDDDLGSTSHGGLVLDSSGRVAGMINTDFAHKDRLNRVVTSLEHVNRSLTAANVTTAMSEMDTNYREGLNAYFGGRYTESIRRLDSVLAVMPDHAMASSYRKLALDRRAIEGDASESPAVPMWLLAVLIGLGVALLATIVAVIRLVRRRPSSSDWQPPISALPVSSYPISSLPTSGAGHVQYDFGPSLLSQDEQTTMPYNYPDPDGRTTRPVGRNEDNPWAPQ